MKQFVPLIALVVLCGCARFSTKQTDISSTNPYGEPTRTITTKASSYTLFSGNSDLAKFKATQTDKSQSASVGSLTQEAGGTNAVAMLRAIADILAAMPK